MQPRQARRHRIAAAFDLQLPAEALAGRNNVVNVDGLDHQRATDPAVHIAHQPWPLDDLDATNQVGIDVVAVADAVVAAPDGQRLFAPVDADRHPPRPLDAADVDVQSLTTSAGLGPRLRSPPARPG
ncbi:hypothetical protein G6F57_020251 [Rhizopus arrhizus]|nr:hypothetical protein G6F57_020251 [Rhizopus arrhizus]